MFEQVAEEMANKKYPIPRVCNELDFARNFRYKEGFKDGAMFVYNKVDKLHYVKDGDLPKNNTQVLALLENKRLKISIFMENKFTIWNRDCDTYTKLYGVIAWKEIILPKEL